MKKHSLCCWAVLGATLVPAWGCRPRLGATADSGLPSVMSADAGPTQALEVRIEVHRSDGGQVSALLEPAVVAVLPVTRAIDITANRQLQNYRIRIFDENDRALASDDYPEQESSTLRYRIVLLAPLRAGHRYGVLIDAQSGLGFEDASGAAQRERRFEFRTEGEREKDVPAKGSQSKRRHHGGVRSVPQGS